MSVGAATILRNGRSGEKGAGVRSYERVYQVVCTALTDNEAAVLGASGLPAIGAAHPGDSSSKCRSLRAALVEGLTWNVTARYEIPPSGSGGSFKDDPTDADPIIAFDVEWAEEVMEKDKDGTAVVNSAGDPFDPPITRTWPRLVIQITKNVATYNPETVASYLNTVNSDSVTIAGKSLTAGQALLRKWSGVKRWSGTSSYYETTYEIVVDTRRGFQAVVLDQGYYYKSGSYRKPCVDTDGQPVQKPALLNGGGAQLAVGGTAVFKTFNVYYTSTFASLSLPTAS